MWSKKWYLKRNISCDVDLLNELLETDVPWDDAIVVSAGKLRERWDSLSELRSSVCERRLERTVLRPALLPVKTAQFTQFFRQVWRHTVKSLSLSESVLGSLLSEEGIVRSKATRCFLFVFSAYRNNPSQSIEKEPWYSHWTECRSQKCFPDIFDTKHNTPNSVWTSSNQQYQLSDNNMHELLQHCENSVYFHTVCLTLYRRSADRFI